jgi:serine/threonine protein kinase
MDQNVADMLSRLERERPADPVAAVRSWCDGDERLAERVLQLLSDDGTRDVPPSEDEDLPVVPVGSSPDDRTLDGSAPTTNAPLLSGSGSSHGSRGARSGTGSGSTTSRFRRPDRIGPFRIEGQIPLGRGGFGEVWEAVRVDGGFKQRVAIKVISRATPDDRLVRRFELERQVLASLDHPDIARLIDGGELDDGRPWLAMEFIEGSAITRYCDRERLTVDERIRLFIRVALAVQHAHENLIVHRDIKPDNVMVTPKGDPKLLDFGIAKLVNPELGGDSGRVTQVGEGVLTPDYAAPEQFSGEAIGTRADVYSLGVLLYELLTGRLPHHEKERGYASIRSAKLETEPPRPSDAVSTATVDPETAARITAERDTGLDRLRRRLDGDLDVIILKALRREASRRYASPRELVNDLQRHLEGLPVEARPDSIAYRTTRFVARHRAGVAVSAAMLLAATFAAVSIAAVANAKATKSELEVAAARADAEAARAETVEAVRAALADLELEAAEGGRESIMEALQSSGQLDAADRISASMLERLEAAATAAPDDADLTARLLNLRLQRARIQWQRRNPSLGDRSLAADLRTAVARDLATALKTHPEHADLLLIAAMLEIEEADALPTAEREPRLDTALSMLDRAEATSGRRFDRQRAMLNTDRGDALAARGETEAALAAYQTSHAAHRERGEDATRDLAVLETRMASLHAKLGQDAEARDLHETSLERRRQLAERATKIESARARRDLALGYWYLAESLAASSPTRARRHLEQYLELAFEVAWLDPLDQRGAVEDLMSAMSRASRLVTLDGGDPTAFAETIDRFRRSIVAPRLDALPDAASRRLAIRADRYLAEVALALAAGAEADGAIDVAARHRDDTVARLDRTIEIARTLLDLERDDSELTAEVGLCLAYRASALPGDPGIDRLRREATELLELSREQGEGGSLQRKLARQLDADPASGTTR